MKHILYFVVFLSFIIISNFAWAQIPFCRCDTAQADGITGDEIIEQICPGGELADEAVFALNEEVVSVALGSLGYEVITSDRRCFVENNGDQGGLADMSPEDLLDCRERLIEGCNLDKINIIRNVPTLSNWAILVMAGILSFVGFMVIRRRKALV